MLGAFLALDVLLVYAGLLAALLGFVSILRPLRLLRIRTRQAGGLVFLLGLALALVGAGFPAPLKRSSGSLLIDRFMPLYHFAEIHSTRIHAPPDRIFPSIRAVTPGEVRWLRTLFWIRSLPARLAGEAVRNAEERRPFLEPKPGSGSLILAEEPDRELVLGLVGQFWKAAGGSPARIESHQDFLAFDRPGYAKATFNFSLQDQGAGWCRLTTETRVFTPDRSTHRMFAAYWRVIYPGSSLLRTTLLAAIKRRAEGAGS